MNVKKAVITAAGPNQHRLPLQRFVDLNGQEKTALQIVIEEVASAGVDEIGVVVRCGDQPAYTEAAGEYADAQVRRAAPAARLWRGPAPCGAVCGR